MTEERPFGTSFFRGLRKKCPQCGEGRVFNGYIKVKPVCDVCGLELHHQRADDAPPYFTMLIVLHFVGSGILTTQQMYDWPNWVHMSIWIPAATIASLLLLPPIKGALIAIQWARFMHGFSGEKEGYTAQQID
ncbi:DUF983 domain-containing protein [Sneathiella limimaris]|uniref:DUF983 domain-containing protein n=1 Tax=Sneathiella limimaris TaxID=1964213 RepID=UPI00146CC97D|nr:DUF983 domain-containing protein [Sneathiella limimaris]